MVASLSQYAVQSLFSIFTLMSGFAFVKASTACWVSLSRESLPQVETRRVVPFEEDPPPLPGAQAAAKDRRTTAITAVIACRHRGGTAWAAGPRGVGGGRWGVVMPVRPFSIGGAGRGWAVRKLVPIRNTGSPHVGGRGGVDG